MTDFNPRRCPRCGSSDTVSRFGMHFDRERRCRNCDCCYAPEEERQKWEQQEAARRESCTDRD